MSLYWGYRCEACQEDSPAWLNHAYEQLEALLRGREHVVALNTAGIDFLEMRVWTAWDPPSPIDFLTEHARHSIVVVNEHGETIAEWTRRVATTKGSDAALGPDVAPLLASCP